MSATTAPRRPGGGPVSPVEGSNIPGHHRHHGPGEWPGAICSNLSIASGGVRGGRTIGAGATGMPAPAMAEPSGRGRPLGSPGRATGRRGLWWCAASFSRLQHRQEHGGALTMAGPPCKDGQRAKIAAAAMLSGVAGLSGATTPARPHDSGADQDQAHCHAGRHLRPDPDLPVVTIEPGKVNFLASRRRPLTTLSGHRRLVAQPVWISQVLGDELRDAVRDKPIRTPPDQGHFAPIGAR